LFWKKWSHQIIIQTSIKQKIIKQIINRKYFERGVLTFFGCATKKQRSSFRAKNSMWHSWNSAHNQLVGFHALKTGQRWDDNNKNTRILNAQKVA